jgi:hypothetical protein
MRESFPEAGDFPDRDQQVILRKPKSPSPEGAEACSHGREPGEKGASPISRALKGRRSLQRRHKNRPFCVGGVRPSRKRGSSCVGGSRPRIKSVVPAWATPAHAETTPLHGWATSAHAENALPKAFAMAVLRGRRPPMQESAVSMNGRRSPTQKRGPLWMGDVRPRRKCLSKPLSMTFSAWAKAAQAGSAASRAFCRASPTSRRVYRPLEASEPLPSPGETQRFSP